MSNEQLKIHYNCLKCGKCCHEIPKESIPEDERDEHPYKRIPIFPEEADRLEQFAQEKKIPLRILEDLVFPDLKNKKILVLTYRILLDNEDQVCPFWSKEMGCIINSDKPLACQAFPLAIKTEDAFNMKINIDPLCSFTLENRSAFEGLNFENLLKIYNIEYPLAKNLLKRSKSAIMSLIEKQQSKEIEIPLKIEGVDFDKYLKEWDRVIIT